MTLICLYGLNSKTWLAIKAVHSLADPGMGGPGGPHRPNIGAGGRLNAAVTKHTDSVGIVRSKLKAVVAGTAIAVPIIRPTMYDQILGRTFRKLY